MNRQETDKETKATKQEAGKIRRILLSQKAKKENFPLSNSRNKIELIKYPEITKNTSTPTKPPGQDTW